MAKIRVPAVLGFFDDAHDLLIVGEKARVEKGFRNLDAYSPYPVHGIEEALDIRPSWIITAARVGLLAGFFLGFAFQTWASAIDWPINIGGKPFVSWPAWIPITFECGVLLAGFTNLLCLFGAAALYPRAKTVVLSRRVTNDRFVLVIPVKDEAEEKVAVQFLQSHKALKVKIIEGIDKENERILFRAAPMATETAAT